MAEEKPAGGQPSFPHPDPAAAGPHEHPLPPRTETSAETEKQPTIEHPDGRIEHPWVSFEHRDAWTRAVLLILLGLFAVAVLQFFLVRAFYFSQDRAENALKKSPYPLAPKPSDQAPSEPRLEQIDRLKGLARENVYRREASKERLLHTYGDTSEAGFVRIPIERAIEIVAADVKDCLHRAARSAPRQWPGGQRRTQLRPRAAEGASMIMLERRRLAALAAGIVSVVLMTFAPCALAAKIVPRGLEDVGFDQRLNEQVPLGSDIHRRQRPAGEARRLFRFPAGHPGVGVLSVPHALHAGAQ